MKQIICDDLSLDVISDGVRVFKVAKGDIETVLILHEKRSFPAIIKRLLSLPELTYFKGITLLSRDLSVILDQNDSGLNAGLEWLMAEGWGIDEAMGRSFRNPGVRTNVVRKEK